jgi:hypothetical protein
LEIAMKHLALAALIAVVATTAYAQQPAPATCKAQATDKKLAGAALNSFMTKCAKDATAACVKSATEKKLAGAARTSHVKKCVGDKTGA